MFQLQDRQLFAQQTTETGHQNVVSDDESSDQESLVQDTDKQLQMKTIQNFLFQDNVTNLRRNTTNLRDLTDFKRLSKKIQLPNFSVGSGSIGRPDEVASESLRTLNQRSYYLSHHSEIVASKSVSKEHRRQDRVLRAEHLDFMNTNTRMPMKSSQTYLSELGRRRATIDEGQALRTVAELPEVKRGLRGFGTMAQISKLSNTTEATELTPQGRSRHSTFTNTFRSRSIAPRSTSNMEPSALGAEDKAASNQGRAPFAALAPAPTQTFHASGFEGRSQQFRGFVKSGPGRSTRQASLPFNLNTPFLRTANADAANAGKESDGRIPWAQLKSQLADSQSFPRRASPSEQNDSQSTHPMGTHYGGFGSSNGRPSLQLQSHQEESSDSKSWSRQHSPSLIGKKLFNGSDILDGTSQDHPQNQPGPQLTEPVSHAPGRPGYISLNQNSSTGFHPGQPQQASALGPGHRVEQLQLNPLMFRKHDPQYRINQNLSVMNQLRDGSHLAGGGHSLRTMNLTSTSLRQQDDSPDKSQFNQTFSAGFDTGEGTLVNKLQNKQALRTTCLGDIKQFTHFERVKGKSPLARKKDLLNTTVQSQLRTKREYARQVGALLEQDRVREAAKEKLETEAEFRKRMMNAPPFEELKQDEAKDSRLNRNAENVRQVSLKLHRTGERFMAMFDATRADFRANIEVLDWQQKQQLNNTIGEHNNIGFKDFVTVKGQYHKEQAKKKMAKARACKHQIHHGNSETSSPRKLTSPETKKKMQRKLTVEMQKVGPESCSSKCMSPQKPSPNNLSPRSNALSRPSPSDSKFPPGSPERERLPTIRAMENTNLAQVNEFIQMQSTLNQERLMRPDSTFSTTSGLCQEREPESNLEILELEKTAAADAIEYVQMIKALFTTKVARDSGEEGDEEAHRRLRAAAVESLPEFGQDDVEDNEGLQVQGKMKKQLPSKLQHEKLKIQQNRLRELLHNTDAQNTFKEDPLFHFMQLCVDEDVASLPVLQKLARKRFILIDQKLTPLIWKALAETINHFEKRQVRQIYIQQTFLDDLYFPKVLDQMHRRPELQSLALVKLSLGAGCLNSLVNLLQQHRGLKKLQMADCQFIGKSTEEFLDELSQEPVRLEKLALISLGLGDKHLPALEEFMVINSKIVDLDIAWNRFTAAGLLEFITKLEAENKLKSLNLSWNSLKPPKDPADALAQYKQYYRRDAVEYKSRIKGTNLSVVDLQTTEVLGSYLKRSNKLQHLDLSNTLLAERAVHYVVKRLAKSLTIQSVHFSGVREQLSDDTKAFIQETLNPMDLRGHSHKKTKEYFLKYNQSSAVQQPDFRQEALKESKSLGPPPRKEGANDQADPAINDAILDQLIMDFNRDDLLEKMRAEGDCGLSYNASAGSKYVLQRILGHPEIDSYDMQESHAHLEALIRDNAAQTAPAYDRADQMSINKHFSRWFTSEHCWLCNKSRYFMPIFLQSEIQTEEESGGRLTSKQDNQLMRLLAQDNQAVSKLQKDQPYIVGTVTNNRVLKMKKVIEFLLKLDPDRAEVLAKFGSHEKKIQEYYKARLPPMLDAHLSCKPYFDRNLTRLVDDEDCMYLHNDFVRPGSHSYFIVVPDGEGDLKYKKEFVTFIKPRKEDLVTKTLPLEMRDEKLEAQKEQCPSLVQAPWKSDPKARLQTPLLDDLEQWKVAKLLTPEVYDKLVGCMKANALYLFALHKRILCQSECYPKVGFEDMRDFFVECRVAQSAEADNAKVKLLSEDQVADLYSGTLSQDCAKSEDGEEGEDDQSDNNAVLLNLSQPLERFEFFELLVRTAREKFKSRLMEAPEALERMIQDHFVPHFDTEDLLEDQVFVAKEVCDRDVNEILHLNRVTLKRLYTGRGRASSAVFETADAIKLMEPLYPRSELLIKEFFNRSKMQMTILGTPASDNQAKQLEFAEFIVFVCLLAKNQQQTSGQWGDQGDSLRERLTGLLRKLCTQYGYKMEVPHAAEVLELEVTYSEDTGYLSDPERGFSNQEKQQKKEDKAVEKKDRAAAGTRKA